MKGIGILIFMLLAVKANAQDGIKGAVYDFKTGARITINHKGEAAEVYLASTQNKSFAYKIEKDGSFFIPSKDIDALTDSIKFWVFCFDLINNITKPNRSYANFDIINIPKDSIKLILSKVFLTPAYWKRESEDVIIVDDKRTFGKKQFLVKTDAVKYYVRRVHEKAGESYLPFKYVADLKKDIIH
jgi:hypothetical protein